VRTIVPDRPDPAVVYEKQAGSFDEMTNLPAVTRQKLADDFEFNAVHAVKTRNATGHHRKFSSNSGTTHLSKLS